MIRELFGFEGRINRATMWTYYLISCFAAPLAFLPDMWPTRVGQEPTIFSWPATPAAFVFRILQWSWILVIFWFMFAAIVKRFHDRGRSAAWLIVFYGPPAAFFA